MNIGYRVMDRATGLRRILRRAAGLLGCLAWLAVPVAAADAPGAEPAEVSRFFDPQDGWFDVSSFLDTAYGFVPLVAPITEPAVGYGAVGALVFIDREEPGKRRHWSRPNIAVLGGLSTENGTRGAFAGHLGSWLEGRLRTEVALADADVNLEFFGLGGGRPAGPGLGYTIAAQGGMAGGSYRLGETPFWFGLRYGYAKTNVSPNLPDLSRPGISQADLDLRLAALSTSLTLDLRDNFFTPTDGWYADLSVALFREALGSDRDFERATLTAMHYRPLGDSLYLSLRGTASTSSDGTPFFLRPYIWLRGVQAMRYQGDDTAEIEAELRWQFHPRFSLVGFGGTGVARSEVGQRDREQSASAWGAGFRYLVARDYGLHMGLDVAQGPDGPIYYVVFGSAWIRP